MKYLVEVLLAAALAIVVLTIWFLRRDYAARNREILPGMVVSVPYDAQSPNPNFADGKTLRTPVPGTEARGFPAVHFVPTPEDARRAGETIASPLSDTLAGEVARGAAVFTNICSPCHGLAGLGDGTVVKKGFPPPPSLLAEKARMLKDGQMYHILTEGQNNMPSLSAQVTRADRWRVILYVRSLQRNAVPLAGK
jgi:mono/diheme cytochrome c family protein